MFGRKKEPDFRQVLAAIPPRAALLEAAAERFPTPVLVAYHELTGRSLREAAADFRNAHREGAAALAAMEAQGLLAVWLRSEAVREGARECARQLRLFDQFCMRYRDVLRESGCQIPARFRG